MHDRGHLILETFLDLKEQLSAARGIQSLLHVHIGLVVFLIATFLLRRRPAYLPLLVVGVMQAASELIDWMLKPGFRIDDSLFDSTNTLFWPALLTLLIVYYRRSLAKPTRPSPEPRASQDATRRPLRRPRGKSSDDDVRVAIRGMLRGME